MVLGWADGDGQWSELSLGSINFVDYGFAMKNEQTSTKLSSLSHAR
jgi:hypothetical protein